MLVKLMPEQISSWWEYIKYALKDTGPPGFFVHVIGLNEILEALLIDRMQCWWYFRDDNPVGIVITEIRPDANLKIQFLNIFALYTFVDSNPMEWKDASRTLIEYARSRKCVAIEAFTDNDQLVTAALRIGWKRRNYIYMEIPNEKNSGG